MIFKSALLALTICLFCGPSLAQTSREQASCERDVKKFCPDIKPGGGRIINCLAARKAELSATCAAVVSNDVGMRGAPGPGDSAQGRDPRLAQDQAACGSDVRKYCSGGGRPTPGDEGILTCLLQHKDQLTDTCRRNVESHQR